VHTTALCHRTLLQYEQLFDTIHSREPLAQIRSGIEGLAGEDRSGWMSAALTDCLSEVVALRDRLDAEVLRLTGEWDRRRAWEADGALSAVSWMTHRLPMSHSRARDDVRTARFIDGHDRVAKAVAAGDVTVDHVRTLGRVVNDRRHELFADQADALVDAAEMLSVGDFAKVARRWGQLADDQLASTDFMEQYNSRRLTIARTFGGAIHIEGLLDPEAGGVFMAAIDVLSAPDPNDTSGGPRSAPQRRADAVVQMSRIVMQGAEGTGVSLTNLNAIVDINTLAGHLPGRPLSDIRCDLDRAGPIGWETLLRMSCDCAISRVVVKGRSEILDVGRKTRLITAVQRRALVIRDGGCVFPGCDRPESWCDAHHLDHWALGGNTDLGRLCLVCRRHHVLVHEGGWTIQQLPEGTWQATPPDT
jgi:hypothetical protein